MWLPSQPPLDPIGRREQTGPDPIDERAIAGARLVGAGEHHEQRRGIHAAVIATEWNLAQRRHLPAPRLVHDFARLSIAKRGVLLGLSRGEKLSTPAASCGLIHSVCNEVMIASRPNCVANHGMPAYGYGPVGSAVVSNARSERDSSIH